MLSWCMLQGEGTSSPVALRARSRDSPSPSEELPSPLTRGKRPATRSRGQGDGSGTDGTTSLPPKRLCLSSAGGLVRTNITEVFCLFLLCFFFFKWWHQTLSEGIRTVLPGYSASVSRVIWVFCLVYISVRNFVKLKHERQTFPFLRQRCIIQMLTYYLLFQDGPLPKNVFDPLAQHREWCPWISVGKENVDPGAIPFSEKGSGLYQQGWKAALDLLMPMKKNSSIDEGSPAQARQKVQIFIFHKKESSDMNMIDLQIFALFVCFFFQGPRDKSKRVFAIFRQWQVSSSPSQ